eukprot:6738692-Pyramimonas_sp.AAC.1
MAYLNLYQQAGDKFALLGIENAEILQNHPGLAALRMGTETYVDDEFVNAAPHDGEISTLATKQGETLASRDD